jgi:hypothetical protein
MRHRIPSAALAGLFFTAGLVVSCDSKVVSQSGAPPPTVSAPHTTPYPVATPPRVAIASPTAVTTASPGAALDPAIVISSPRSGESVTSPVKVSGTASVFEAALNVRVKDSTGKVVGQARTTASTGAPGRGTYSVDVPFDASGPGTIEAYTISPRDGKETDLVSVPVVLASR